MQLFGNLLMFMPETQLGIALGLHWLFTPVIPDQIMHMTKKRWSTIGSRLNNIQCIRTWIFGKSETGCFYTLPGFLVHCLLISKLLKANGLDKNIPRLFTGIHGKSLTDMCNVLSLMYSCHANVFSSIPHSFNFSLQGNLSLGGRKINEGISCKRNQYLTLERNKLRQNQGELWETNRCHV